MYTYSLTPFFYPKDVHEVMIWSCSLFLFLWSARHFKWLPFLQRHCVFDHAHHAGSCWQSRKGSRLFPAFAHRPGVRTVHFGHFGCFCSRETLIGDSRNREHVGRNHQKNSIYVTLVGRIDTSLAKHFEVADHRAWSSFEFGAIVFQLKNTNSNTVGWLGEWSYSKIAAYSLQPKKGVSEEMWKGTFASFLECISPIWLLWFISSICFFRTFGIFPFFWRNSDSCMFTSLS